MLDGIKSILLPVQIHEETALKGAEIARIFVERGPVTMHLLHIVSALPVLGQTHVVENLDANLEGKAEHDALEKLKAIAQEYLPGVKCQFHARGAFVNEVATAITTTAKDLDVDLIIMKTHGRHGLARLILGSVTEEVVRSAPCMVTTLTSEALDRAIRSTSLVAAVA
ncbi:MAG: universal stress protein [Candidatus Binataceae bacterium]|jgi:nucleotide-binding universal stress UspA family protein